MKTQLFAFSAGLLAVALMFTGCAEPESTENTDSTEQVNAMVGDSCPSCALTAKADGAACCSEEGAACCSEGDAAAKSCCSEGDVAAKSCCSEGDAAVACTDCDGEKCCGKCEGDTQTVSTEAAEGCTEGCNKCAEGKEEECECGDKEAEAETAAK